MTDIRTSSNSSGGWTSKRVPRGWRSVSADRWSALAPRGAPPVIRESAAASIPTAVRYPVSLNLQPGGSQNKLSVPTRTKLCCA